MSRDSVNLLKGVRGKDKKTARDSVGPKRNDRGSPVPRLLLCPNQTGLRLNDNCVCLLQQIALVMLSIFHIAARSVPLFRR